MEKEICSCGHQRKSHVFNEYTPEGMCSLSCDCKRFNTKNKKILFSATIREVQFLLDRDYLNKEGRIWANSVLEEENEK